MDPNRVLKQLRQSLIEVEFEEGEARLSALEDVALCADALDAWMSGGGFLPEPWTKGSIRHD